MLYATGFIGYFYLIIPIVGFGASALVGRELIAKVDAGGNMAAPLVAELLGGTPFLGFIVAVAFATILAVVAGLTLAGASALSHDIFVHVIRGGEATDREQGARRASRPSSSACSPCCSALFSRARTSRSWSAWRLRSRAAQLPGAAPVDRLAPVQHRRRGQRDRHRRGALGAPAQPDGVVDIFHNSAIFPLRNPAIVSMPAAFAVAIVVSYSSREPSARSKFDDEKLRTYLGVGAE